MILQFNDTAPQYNGRVDGDVILRNGTRGVGRIRSRPSTSRQRQAWVPPWSFKTAAIAFAALDESTRDEWETAADTLSAWPIQGSPRYTTAQVFFQNYYTVLLLLDAGAAVPAAPPSGPLWQTLPQWFEFAEWISDRYTLKAETEFEADTHLLFSGLPPSPSVFNGEWFGEKIVGDEIFYSGLYPDDEWDGIHDMIENTYGTINNTMKIWGRVWEVYPNTGFVRVLKDPCTTDPNGAAVSNQLFFTVYNDHDSNLSAAIFNIMSPPPEIDTIGAHDTYDIPYQDTRTFTLTLDEPHTTAEIGSIAIEFYWDDGQDYFADDPWDGNVIVEISATPS